MNKIYLDLANFHTTLPIRGSSPSFRNKVFNDFTEFKYMPCWCRSNKGDSPPFLKGDRFGLNLNFVACKNCGTIRITNYPSSHEITHFYSNNYRHLYFSMDVPSKLHINDEQRSRARRFIRLLNSKNIDIDGKSVLEIGCGAGGILSVFKEHGAYCFGIEPHNQYSQYCRDTFMIPCFTGMYQMAFEQQPTKKKFDIIIISHVLEHLLDVKKDLQQILSMFARNGTILVIEVPSLEKMGASNRFIDYFHIAHPWSFNKKSLTSLLSTCPLKSLYIDNVITSISLYNSEFSTDTKNIMFTGFNYTIYLILLGVIKDNLRVLNKTDRLLYGLKKIKDYLLELFAI